MVASWAKFKRHHFFFKALSKIKSKGRKLNVVLVGYPADMQQHEILELAKHHKVEDFITIYEWIKPEEVASLLKRSKINIIWSRFEGNNRALIEGMFCDTPSILREGHNYGESYDFINSKTGCFANDDNLEETILKMLDQYRTFSPREYVMKNRNCISATNIMNNVIREFELSQNRLWTRDLVVKVNELHGMCYLNSDDLHKFKNDYDRISSWILKDGFSI